MLYSEYLVAVFLLFYSVTEVESKPWIRQGRPFQTGYQGNTTSSRCGVHKMVCNGQ